MFSGREASLTIHCLQLTGAGTIQARLNSQVALLRRISTKCFTIVTGAEECPTTRPGIRSRVERLAVVGAGMAGLCLAVAVSATMAFSSVPAAADQVSSLKAQAAQIAQDLVLEQLQIGTYQQQYDVDVARVRHDQVEIESSQQQVQSDSSRVKRDRQRLQSEAVSAYINVDPQVTGIEMLFESQKEAPTRTVYEEVASGDISLAIDSLHADENGLRAERVTLEHQAARDQATTNEEATAANAARQTATQLASKRSEITGELAVAVAQQQAAQAAAATAAVQAAQAKAAAAAAARASRPSPASSLSSPAAPQPPPGNPPSADPSLPPFLQCVLQVESGGNYGAVSPGGTYMGGFQFESAHVERSGTARGHAAAHQRPSEPSDTRRAGRPRNRTVRRRRSTTLG